MILRNGLLAELLVGLFALGYVCCVVLSLVAGVWLMVRLVG